MMRKLFCILPLLAPFVTACSHPPKISSAESQVKQKINVVPRLPPRPGSDKNEYLVVIDPGHGGYDLGARTSACNEKSLALSTALLAKKYLNERGYQVVMTRSRDVFVSLHHRAQLANKSKGRLFLSLHFNAAKNNSAEGIEVFYYDAKDKYRMNASKKFAQLVLSKMVDQTGATSRGIKGGNFFVIRETSMPAVLIEGGFITNEHERMQLKDVIYREKLAHSIADAVDAYFS